MDNGTPDQSSASSIIGKNDGKCFTKKNFQKEMKLHRIVRELQFSHPGDAAVIPSEDACSFLTEEGHRVLLARPKKNEVDDEDPDEYHPHHDREGYFVTEDGRHIRLCDCLSLDCTGCHVPCKRCHTRYCGFVCQRGRDFAPEKIEIDAENTTPIYHPFSSKKKSKT